ncbi:hypothetical protein [Anoxybacillus flavithermus]|uniref:hypothetical protein n=1 Tax=Anoxybacillus flavithermus TaxID=33934 RepID=UPI0018666A34|nr:hypothetical protein [Anoxybacillus flavithermus]MBE2908644.1 hypothetical protein [Anoxybacillus flavithermus]MBE2911650.1 hypothetical protein [Anoxybacillus flavithermus]MBE2916860.1 hypothetical protein [Anoxybacillus flavithermus]MBE2920180.1 hypothetical protein [Anoxybacillus flavithermus]MBE2922123.1 hypothetical protein [Anoxybacillus flavithermus]
MFKYLSLVSWILSFFMILFSKNPNGYLLIFLWIVGATLALIGKKAKESGWLVKLAFWLNVVTVTVYVLWVYIVGLIWSSP